jgi:hypothetical protein
LSKTTDVDVARLLEAAAVAHQQAVLRAQRRRDRDDQRHGEPQRVGARDDEHRHHPHDREVDGRADEQPDDERERPGGRAPRR